MNVADCLKTIECVKPEPEKKYLNGKDFITTHFTQDPYACTHTSRHIPQNNLNFGNNIS